jgi:pyruvate/2-oxoglutarate dehydrogenase complex dihydrolipoamide acyltransferase (E2) component
LGKIIVSWFFRLFRREFTNSITQAKDGERGLPVGKVIALLVEEGDDISNLEVPEEDTKPAEPARPVESEKRLDAVPSSAPASSSPNKPSSRIHVDGPAFPSVTRLLNEAGIKDYKKIKGTGVRGMLTKGDVLAYMGKASSPTGTYKKVAMSAAPQAAAAAPKKEAKVLSRRC